MFTTNSKIKSSFYYLLINIIIILVCSQVSLSQVLLNEKIKLIKSDGQGNTCAITNSGEVYCWGQHFGETLDDGTILPNPNPTKILKENNEPLTNVRSLIMESIHHYDENDKDIYGVKICALTEQSEIYCWKDDPLDVNDRYKVPYKINLNLEENDSLRNIKQISFVGFWGSNYIYRRRTDSSYYSYNTCPCNFSCCEKTFERCPEYSSSLCKVNGPIMNGWTGIAESNYYLNICAITTNGELYCFNYERQAIPDEFGIYYPTSLLPEKIIFQDNLDDKVLKIKNNRILFESGNISYIGMGWGMYNNSVCFEETINDNQVACVLKRDYQRGDTIASLREISAYYGDIVINDYGEVFYLSSDDVACKLYTDNNNIDVMRGIETLIFDERHRYGNICAISKAGEMLFWDAYNDYGECVYSTPPTKVFKDNRYVLGNVNGGCLVDEKYACALVDVGDLYCWGEFDRINVSVSNSYHTSNTLNHNYVIHGSIYPRKMPIKNVSDVVCNEDFICASTYDGNIFCLGSNDKGQLGNGKVITNDFKKANVSNITEVSAGGNFTCVLNSNNEVYCFGLGDVGELGNGKSGLDYYERTPQKVNLSNVKSISTGYDHACAVTNDGNLYCWGGNEFGQIGNGTINDKTTPVKVNLNNVLQVSASYKHTCAVTSEKLVYCWGHNSQGELGTGDTLTKVLPSQVYKDNTVLNNIIHVSIGYNHACAVSASSNVYCWGNNAYGQLGSGDTSSNMFASQVFYDVDKISPLKDVIKVSTRDYYSCALTRFGEVYCFGGTKNTQRLLPTRLWNNQNIVDIASSVHMYNYGATCGVTSSGQAICSGENFWYDDKASSHVLGIGNVAQISLGVGEKGVHTCVLDIYGYVWCHGHNRYGELGDGSLDYETIPQKVIQSTGYVESCNQNNNCCNHRDADKIGQSCESSENDTCFINSEYKCFGDEENPIVVCHANKRESSPEVCNNLDDDCDGIIDNGFGIGNTCSNNVGTGVRECKNELETYCKISVTFTPTNTYTKVPTHNPSRVTPTFTKTPSFDFKVVIPSTVLIAPRLTNKVKRKASFELEAFDRASIKSDGSENLKYKYFVEVKKTKRVKVDKNYKLKVAVTKMINKNTYSLTKLDKGTYYIRYKVRIIKGKKFKETKWSSKIKFAI